MEIGQVVNKEQVRRGQMIHVCEPFERSYHVTSWTTAWKGLDFSSALLVDSGMEEYKEKEKQEEERQRRTTSELLVLGTSESGDGPKRCKCLCLSD